MTQMQTEIQTDQKKDYKTMRFLLCLLTANCPLRCKMCFNWENSETDEIESSHIKATIDWLQKNDFFRDDAVVAFSGGETLLREDVFNLIKFCSGNGLRTSLGTSGYIYNEQISEKIKESQATFIGLPLDSLIAEKHDYLRGRQGVFRNVLKIIEEHPKKVNLTCTISAYNVDEICAIAQWADGNDKVLNIGFQSVVTPFNTNLSKKDWYKNADFSHLWPKDIEAVRKSLDKLIEFAKKSHKIYTTPRHLAFFKEYFSDPGSIHREAKCRVGDYSLTITNKGDAMFCGYIGGLGNIRKKNIGDILSSNDPGNVRRRMLECDKTCEFFVNCFFEDQ